MPSKTESITDLMILEDIATEKLFSEFRQMLVDAYRQAHFPSVDDNTCYLLRLHLTEEQNNLWDKVMNPKPTTPNDPDQKEHSPAV